MMNEKLKMMRRRMTVLFLKHVQGYFGELESTDLIPGGGWPQG